ncbi:HEAT repeat domain-containing protein [Candidatus Omnitrophota bacterium]
MHNKRFIENTLIFFIFIFLFCHNLRADVIYLKNEREIEGTVTKETEDTVEVSVYGGIIKLDKQDIIYIEKDEGVEVAEEIDTIVIRTIWKQSMFVKSYKEVGADIILDGGTTEKVIPKKDIEYIEKRYRDGRRSKRMFQDLPGHVKERKEILLNSPDSRKRSKAAHKLKRTVDPRIEEALITAFINDTSASVRAACAGALGAYSDLRAIESLIAGLKDASKEVRFASAWSLGEIGTTAAVEPLIIALQDEEWSVRNSAVIALGEIGSERAMDYLAMTFINEKNERVRKNAKIALDKVKVRYRSKVAFTEAKAISNEMVQRKLNRFTGSGELSSFVTALSDESASTRRGAITRFAKKENPQITELLIIALEDIDPSVREQAVLGLKKRLEYRWDYELEPSAVEPLIATLKDKYNKVRMYSAELLGYTKNSRAIAALVDSLNDEDAFVRDRVRSALINIGEVALAPLFTALKDGYWEEREAAAWALGGVRDSRALEPLTAALEDENENVRKTTQRALENLKLNIRLQGDRQFQRKR